MDLDEFIKTYKLKENKLKDACLFVNIDLDNQDISLKEIDNQAYVIIKLIENYTVSYKFNYDKFIACLEFSKKKYDKKLLKTIALHNIAIDLEKITK